MTAWRRRCRSEAGIVLGCRCTARCVSRAGLRGTIDMLALCFFGRFTDDFFVGARSTLLLVLLVAGGTDPGVHPPPHPAGVHELSQRLRRSMRCASRCRDQARRASTCLKNKLRGGGVSSLFLCPRRSVLPRFCVLCCRIISTAAVSIKFSGNLRVTGAGAKLFFCCLLRRA